MPIEQRIRLAWRERQPADRHLVDVREQPGWLTCLHEGRQPGPVSLATMLAPTPAGPEVLALRPPEHAPTAARYRATAARSAALEEIDEIRPPVRCDRSDDDRLHCVTVRRDRVRT